MKTCELIALAMSFTLLFSMIVLMSQDEESASHLVMRADLSDSYASFYMEYKGDNSGFSVAGAGVVYRDGYDDILIGAWTDEDGGFDEANPFHGSAHLEAKQSL